MESSYRESAAYNNYFIKNLATKCQAMSEQIKPNMLKYYKNKSQKRLSPFKQGIVLILKNP
jgi:hypothetical protein